MKRAWLLLLCAVPLLPHETLTTTVLFDREIVRILNRHCVMCHAAGGPSFPLETFDQTWLKKREIHTQTLARHMPPWPAVPGYGQFANENSLTLRESQFIISWVEGLGPRNSGTVFLNVTGPDAARPPEIRAHADFGHWALGEPQAKYKVESVIDLGFKSARRVRAVEYLPSDRRTIRAAVFKVKETGQWIGSWTPWYGYLSLPAGRVFVLPAGAHIVAEIQYNGAAPADQGSLGLHFAEGRVMGADLTLPAKLAVATSIVALRVEPAAGTKSVEVSARTPDGGTEILLYAKEFSSEWPTPFVFKTPRALPAGTQLRVNGAARVMASKY
jgi:hypothetical protein